MRLRDLAFLSALPVLFAACGKDEPAAQPSGKTPHEEHKAPHGGHILELGDGEAHVEVVHDPQAGVVTLYVYGKDFDTPVAVAAPVILVAVAGVSKELTPVALDAKPGQATATAWKLTDPSLTVDPIDGRIRVTVNGKQHQSPLEPAGHGH